MILLHFRFLFIRLPSSRRCGLAETVGLCFRVDSNRATSVFVLGLVCVCVCSVFVALLCLLSDDNSTVDIALSTPWFIREAGSRKTILVLERL